MDISTLELLKLYGRRKANKTFQELWDEAASSDQKYSVRRDMIKLHRKEVKDV